MRTIELELWGPKQDDPRYVEYKGLRTAAEVFEELKQRLDSLGYLPDEYFLMGTEWENGKEIPRDADIFCTTDYGGSEGIYVDVYLKWYEGGKPVTKSFATGKTLDDSGAALDRMFLTASAITKAFHGDNGTYGRYVRLGERTEPESMVVSLNPEEQRAVIDALVQRRELLVGNVTQTEQLLRRMTGSITAYMDEVGHRPLRISDYDKTVLAIHDGELSAFNELYPKAMKDHADDLLIEAAGRSGVVGRQMTFLLLESGTRFEEPVYRAACEKAIDLNDPKKVFFLLREADCYVKELSPSFQGELAAFAYSDHPALSKEIIRRCTDEQIAAAPPRLLELFASNPDYEVLDTLVSRGISSEGSAAMVLHLLTSQEQHEWIAKELLQTRMWVDVNDYAALHACVVNGAVETAKLLLDGGMDFDGYQEWTQRCHITGYKEVTQTLEEHWHELLSEPEQAETQESGGMTFG